MQIDIDVPDGVSGEWSVKTFTVSEEAANINNIRATFSLSARPILPGTYKKLVRGDVVVMSNTPVEISDHLSFIFAAKERESVLINGLGLGVALKEILKSDVVKSVVVVEQSQDVIDLVAPTYLKDPRVAVVHADAFEYKPAKGTKYGAVWHDIWETVCAGNLPEMTKLKRKYGRRAAWQGCWCEYLCKRFRGYGY